MNSYVELHARSAFSFHRGAASPEGLVTQAAKLGMPALGVCDRDGVYGTVRVHQSGKEVGVRGLVGAEVTLEDGSVVPLLVETRAGYTHLCQLLTQGKLRAPKGEGRVRWDELERVGDGLICLTGDEEGPVRRALARRDQREARQALERLLRIFGKGRLYVEIQRHRVRGERFEDQCLQHLAASYGLPLLATNGVCYATPEQRPLLDAFTCLRRHTHLDAGGRWLSRNGERYLKGATAMRLLFADLPEAVDNTLHLANRLAFSLENLGYVFPRYPTAPDETEASTLWRETFAGARRRYGTLTASIKKQLKHELQLIEKLGFCGYFLIVWQIVQFARDREILVQGRGSAANSAVCYSLGITNVDPIGGQLLFERFLSEGRHSWPDIDLDLPSGDRRETVIQEVYRRYAPRGAAMTANVITYRGRSAMREMGKVLNLPEDVLGRFSDLYANGDFPHTLEWKAQIERAGLTSGHPRLPALLDLYQGIYGLPRHLGQHSGGMIISDHPLDTVVPLENASMPGRVVVQWDKDDCEDLGIIKVDLLGLGMMSVIQDTVALCQRRGRGIDLARLPHDDPATYRMIQKADTIGIFQIESRAQMATLPRMKPVDFYDLVIEVAIIRPGPIVGNLVHPYINRRSGKEPVDYIDDRFESVLKRTLGVPLFQEQILKMAMVVADFTGSEAEELRRAMSFHRSEERMRRVMAKLGDAMKRKRVPVEVRERIINSIKSFALYGFPESHAISFALLAYASAWLKIHRTAEFFVGLLNNQPMGFYSSATLIKDAKRHGVRVLPVNVRDSEWGARVVDDGTIQLGFTQVRGFSRQAAERILTMREKRSWRNLDDFLLRTRLQRDERRMLAKVGALNGLASHRRDALWKVEKHLDEGLFQWSAEKHPSNKDEANEARWLTPMQPRERLEADYAGLGLTTGPHPMAYMRDRLAEVWRSCDLICGRDGQMVTIAGMVICRQRPGTAKGHVFISLEDETGIANAFVPSATFEKYRLTITQEPFLKIRGRLQQVDDVISVYTLHVEAMALEIALSPSSYDFR